LGVSICCKLFWLRPNEFESRVWLSMSDVTVKRDYEHGDRRSLTRATGRKNSSTQGISRSGLDCFAATYPALKNGHTVPAIENTGENGQGSGGSHVPTLLRRRGAAEATEPPSGNRLMTWRGAVRGRMHAISASFGVYWRDGGGRSQAANVHGQKMAWDEVSLSGGQH